MKQLLAITAILSATLASAQTPEYERPDTLACVETPGSVLVTKAPDATTITIVGEKDNPDFYYQFTTDNDASSAIADTDKGEWSLPLPFLKDSKSTRNEWEMLILDQVHLGICAPVNAPEGFDNSIEGGVGRIVGVRYSPWRKGPEFAIGIGMEGRCISLHAGKMWSLDPMTHRLSVGTLPEGASDASSRLKWMALEVPFTVSQKIYKDFSISLGATLQLNTYARCHSNYTIDATRYTQKYTGLHQRIATCELYAAVGWRDNVGFYVRYSPTPLFAKAYGPQFNTLSFGLTVGL